MRFISLGQFKEKIKRNKRFDFRSLPKLLSLEQVSEILGVHQNTLRNWDNIGKLKSVRIGKRHDRKYERDRIEKLFLDMRASQAGAKRDAQKNGKKHRRGAERRNEGPLLGFWLIGNVRSVIIYGLLGLVVFFFSVQNMSLGKILFARAENDALVTMRLQSADCSGWLNPEKARFIDALAKTPLDEFLETNSAVYSNQFAFRSAGPPALNEVPGQPVQPENTAANTSAAPVNDAAAPPANTAPAPVPSADPAPASSDQTAQVNPQLICQGYTFDQPVPDGSRLEKATLVVSFAADTFANNEDVVDFSYSFNGKDWKKLSSFALLQDMSNATNDGYLSYPIEVSSFDDIKNLSVRVDYNAFPATQGSRAFFDGAALDVLIRKPPPPKLANELTQSTTIVKADVAPSEDPTLDVTVEKKSTLDFLGVGPTTRDVQSVTITDPGGNTKTVNLDIQDKQVGKNTVAQYVIPKEDLSRPGLYKVSMQVEQDGYIQEVSKEFSWGVIAVNVRSSVIEPDTYTEVGMSVLDDFGHAQCAAFIEVTVRHPGNFVEKFSTTDKTVVKNPTCKDQSVTNEPDYSAFFTTTTVGKYTVDVTATTEKGTHTISDSFEVRSNPQFTIERTEFPTRIFPFVDYPVKFTVTSQQDFTGVFMEKVPVGFQIYDITQRGAELGGSNDPQYKVITWPVALTAGKPYTLGYTFNPPDQVPFLYKLGPANIGNFTEARQWQIASDAACSSAGSGAWTTTATWSGCRVGGPIAGDTVQINSGHMITISNSTAVAAASVTIITNNSATVNGLTFGNSGSSLAITGAITIPAATASGGSLVAVDAGSITTTSGTSSVSISGAAALTSIFRISTGSVTLTGGVTFGGTQSNAQLTFTGAGSLTIGAGMGTGGTFTKSTSTVTFNGTGAQNITGYNYNNLVVNNAGLTLTTVQDGANTFTVGGTTTITAGTLTMGNFAHTFTGATSVTGTLNTSGGTTGNRTFTGAVTVNSSGTWDLSGQNPATIFANGITVSTGATSFNNGTGTVAFNTNNQALAGSVGMTFGGTATIASGVTLTNNNTGTVNFSAATNCLTGASATLSIFTTGTNSTTQCASALLGAGGSSTGLLNPSGTGSTVEYNGGSQTVKAHNSTNNYVNIKLSGSGTKTLTTTDVTYTGNFDITCSSACSTALVVANTAIQGTLTVGANATFTAGAFALTVTGTTNVQNTGVLSITSATGTKAFNGDVTIDNGGRWSVAISVNFTLPGNLTNNGTFTPSTGTYTLSGAGKAISGTFASPFTTVTLTGGGAQNNAGTFTTATLNVNAAFANTGTITVTSALAGTNTLTNSTNGNLNINVAAASYTLTGLAASASGNTVSWGFAGAQTVTPSISYYNLTLAGSGAKTLTNVTTVSNNLTMAGTATATIVTATMAIGGDLVVGGGTTITIGATTTIGGGDITTSGTSATVGTSGTPTVTISGTGSLGGGTSPGLTFYDLTISGTQTINDPYAMTINHTLTVNGTLNGTGSPATLGSIVGTGTITMASPSAWLVYPTASINFGTTSGSTAWTFYSMTVSAVLASADVTLTTQAGTGDITFNGTLQLSSFGDSFYTNLNAGGRNWIMSATNNAKPFELDVGGAGVLIASTSTFQFTGNNASGNVTLQNATYNNLTLGGASAETFDTEASLTVSGTLNVAANGTLAIGSTHTVTHSGATLTLAGIISGAGRLAYQSATAFPTTGTISSIVRFDATNNDQTMSARTYGGNVEIYNVSSSFTRAVTMTATATQVISGSLSINAAGTAGITLDASVNNPTVTVGGSISSTAGGGGLQVLYAGTGSWTVGANFDMTNIQLTVGTGNTIIMSGTGTFTSGGYNMQNLTLSGTITLANAAHTVYGNLDMTGGTITAGTSTMYMRGTANLVGGNQSLYNLTANGNANTLTVTSNVTVTNVLTIGSVGDNNNDTMSINGGISVTSGTSGTVTLSGSGTDTISGAGTLVMQNSNLNTLGVLSSKVRFDATSGDINMPARTYGGAVEIYNNHATTARVVTMLATATQTLSGDLTVIAANGGDITLAGATYNPTVSITGSVAFTKSSTGTPIITTGTGTWTVGTTLDLTNGTFTAAATNTVLMGGTGNLIGAGQTLINLTIDGNGNTVTITTSDISVSGTLTIGGAADGNNDTLSIGSGRLVTSTSAGTVTLIGSGTDTISGTGTLVVKNNNLGTAGTLSAPVRFDATAADLTMPARTYGGDVTIYTFKVVVDRTVTMSAGTYIISGNLDMNPNNPQGGVRALTLDAATNDPAVNVTGNVTNSETGVLGYSIILAGAGTWTITGYANFQSQWGTGTDFLTETNSTLVMNGTSKTLYPGNNLTLYNFTSGGTIAASGMTVSNTLLISSGTLTMDMTLLTVGNNFTNNGAYTASSGTVNMTGTSGSIGGSASTTFYNLLINGTNITTTVNTSATVSATLTVGAAGDGNNDELSIASGKTLTSATTGTVTLIGSGTDSITGLGTLVVRNSNLEATNGTISANVQFNASSGSINMPARSYGGNVEIYSSGILPRTVTIASSGTVNITGNLTVTDAGTGVSLSGMNNPTVNITGSINPCNPATDAFITTGTGVWTVSAGADFTLCSLTATSGNTLVMNGAGTLRTSVNTLQNLTLSGTITLANEVETIAGNLDMTGGTITPGTSTIVMTGTKDLIGGSQTLNNLTINGVNTTVTAKTSNLSVSGTLTIGGAADGDNDTFTINSGIAVTSGTAGTVTLVGSGTDSITGAGTLTVQNSNLGTGGVLSPIVRFDATNGDIATMPARTYGGLVEIYNGHASTARTVTMSALATQTLSGNLSVIANSGGNITLIGALNNPTVNITGGVSFAKNSTGTITVTSGTGTWSVGGAVNFTNGTYTAATGNVLAMSGSVNLIGNGQSLYDLNVNGTTNTVTATTSDVSIAGTLTVGSGNILSIASGRTVTYSGSGNVAGTGTISGAGTITFTDTSGGPGTALTTLSAVSRYDATNGNIASTTLDARTYGARVEIYSNSTTARTATFATGTYTLSGASSHLYVIADGASPGDVTLIGATNNPTVTIGGDLDFTGVGTASEAITSGTGIWTASGNVNFTDGTYTATAGNTLVMNGTSKTLTSASQTLYNVTLSGSITLANATHTIAGNLDMTGGTITAGTSTVTMTGTSNTLKGGGNTLASLTIDPPSAGTITLSTSTLGAGNVSVGTNGILAGTVDVTVTGNVTGGGAITLTGGTFKQLVNATKTFGTDVASANDWTFYNLSFEAASTTKTITFNGTGTGKIIATNDLATVFNTGSVVVDDATNDRILQVNGNVSIVSNTELKAPPAAAFSVAGNWTNAGTFTPGTGTVTFNATTGTKTIDTSAAAAGNFGNVVLNDGVGNATFQIANGPITVNNNLTITHGTLDTGAAGNYGITIGGNWTNNGVFTANSGLVTANGTSQQTFSGTMTGSSKFNNLTITNVSGTDPDTSPSVIFGSSAQTGGTFTAATANTKLRFLAGGTFTFQNISFNGQATGTRVSLRSSTYGSVWNINVAGTRSVSNTNVEDSDACGQAPDIDASDGTNVDKGNNHCWDINRISVSLSANTINLGTLSTSTVSQGSMISTVTTNAPDGYVSVIYDTQDFSTVGGGTIADAGGSITNGTAGYGVSSSMASQTVAQTTGACSSGAGTFNATSLTATPQTFASSASAVTGQATTLCFLATPSGTTEAGGYSDTATLVTTGRF